MKRITVGLMVALLFVAGAFADTYTYTAVVAANSTNALSDAIPVSGYLDKIEVSGYGATRTSTVVVATYDGTTAIDTLFTKAVSTPAIARLRVQPTDNTATVIAAVTTSASTNTTTMLTVPYERVLVGGNIKISIKNDDGNAVTNKVVFYYEPLRK